MSRGGSLASALGAHWVWALALVVALAPLSAKAGGALFVLLCVAGAAYACVPRAQPNGFAGAARFWFGATLVALVLAVLGRAIWHSAWPELHFHARLAVGALAGLALAGRLGGDASQRDRVAHSLAVACFAALGLAIVESERRLYPSNAIPWAVSIGFLTASLLPRVFETSSVRLKMFWGAGVLAGLAAVLLSQSRSAWAIGPWVVVVGFFLAVRADAGPRARRRAALALLLLAVAVGAIFAASSTVRARTEQIRSEWVAAGSGGSRAGADSSIGARFYLARLAVDGFRESPLVGVGAVERARRIEALGEQLHSPIIRSLGHVHDEPLQSAFDHGLIGIGYYMAIALGLLVFAWRIGRIDRTAGWQLGGIGFMHVTAGLANVNSAHNYYGAMLASAIGLVLLNARARASVDAASGAVAAAAATKTD